MLGAIAGDVIGSIYEWDNIKTKKFELFSPGCRFTDDSVMTLAVAAACMDYTGHRDLRRFRKALIAEMRRLGGLYPDAGYGARFAAWLGSGQPAPYGSFGNGSAMRVSPVAYAADTLDEAEALARASADVTHSHPEGVKGAQAVAAAIFLCRQNWRKADVRNYISAMYYGLDFTLDSIRAEYRFDATCPGSVPQAIAAFLESTGFEDAVRNAISIGGDSDTIACIAGGIAEAYYGIPEDIAERALAALDAPLLDIVQRWRSGLR